MEKFLVDFTFILLLQRQHFTQQSFHISSVLTVEQPYVRSHDGESPQALRYYYKVHFHAYLF